MYYLYQLREFFQLKRKYGWGKTSLLWRGGGALRTALGLLMTTQKSILKLALKKSPPYPSVELLREMDVLDLR